MHDAHPLPRVCVYGAGAVGGHVATRLASAGLSEVSVVARGEHLHAIRQHGLRLRHIDGPQWHARPAHATDDASVLDPQDLVLVGLKAHALPAHAKALRQLLAPQGLVMFLNNGIPWWWPHGLQGAEPAGPLALLDPAGALWNTLGAERVLGAVVYSSNELEAPGQIVHRGSNRFILGEPDGGNTRAQAVAQLFNHSGLLAETSTRLRTEIWRKLLVNASGSPVCALTRLGTPDRVARPELLALSRKLIKEIAAIAEAQGHPLDEADMLNAGSDRPTPNNRPSMLQDVLLSRPMEVEAILGQPQAFARQLGLATPTLDVILALLRGLDHALQNRLHAP